MYHGRGKSHGFFEGWYFKCVDASGRHVYAIIPGVFGGQTPEACHCFVQVLEGLTGHSTYHRYPLDAFWASDQKFDIRIGPNCFRADRIRLDIQSPEQTIGGELRFDGITPWPVTLLSPGVMGWYAWVPFMECYHGIVSMDHRIDGSLALNGEAIDFNGGRGYIEKDWGQAFPRAWIWMQSNHFAQPGTCLMVSVATIPWLGSAFRGFVIGLWHAGRLYRFTTYTGATLERLSLTDTGVRLSMLTAQHRLDISANRSQGGLLHGPYRLDMLQRVAESLTAAVEVRIAARTGEGERLLFSGIGQHAGLEINGDLEQIL